MHINQSSNYSMNHSIILLFSQLINEKSIFQFHQNKRKFLKKKKRIQNKLYQWICDKESEHLMNL